MEATCNNLNGMDGVINRIIVCHSCISTFSYSELFIMDLCYVLYLYTFGLP
jgi:hypothetical protein